MFVKRRCAYRKKKSIFYSHYCYIKDVVHGESGIEATMSPYDFFCDNKGKKLGLVTFFQNCHVGTWYLSLDHQTY